MCSLAYSLPHSLSHALSIACNQNKIRSSQSIRRSTVQRSIWLYLSLYSHSVLKIYTLQIVKESTIYRYVAHGARLITYKPQPFFCQPNKKEERKNAQNLTHTIFYLCMFDRLLIFFSSSLNLFIYFVWRKVAGVKKNREEKTRF